MNCRARMSVPAGSAALGGPGVSGMAREGSRNWRPLRWCWSCSLVVRWSGSYWRDERQAAPEMTLVTVEAYWEERREQSLYRRVVADARKLPKGNSPGDRAR